jgi:glycerol dehydrogenase-like iron-containing ADH family enzyme
MNEQIQTTIVRFDNRGAKIYSTLFKQFSASVRNINRNRDENVFRMQAAKFAETLKYRLAEQAKKILDRSDPAIHKQLQASLSANLNYYLGQFKSRCGAV